MINNTLGVLSMALTAQLGPGRLIVEYSRSHTIRHTKKAMDTSQGVISPSQRPLPTQHTTNTRDEHSRPHWGMNPRSAIRELQTYALDHTAIGIGHSSDYIVTTDRFMRKNKLELFEYTYMVLAKF
jgi:hypothetical protein